MAGKRHSNCGSWSGSSTVPGTLASEMLNYGAIMVLWGQLKRMKQKGLPPVEDLASMGIPTYFQVPLAFTLEKHNLKVSFV